MTLESVSPRYSHFVQAVRRYRPSDLLPMLAAHSAHPEPLFNDRGEVTKRPWWAISAAARESVLRGNEFRSTVPVESDLDRLYRLFNNSFDPIDDQTISSMMTPLAYEQFFYQESPFEELSRAQALLGNRGQFPWHDVLGMELTEALRTVFVLRAWIVHNGGRFDPANLDDPSVRGEYERIAPREHVEGLARFLTATIPELKALDSPVPELPIELRRHAFNPLRAKPLVDLGINGVWAPQSAFVERAITPQNLFHVGMKAWGKTGFADKLGPAVEAYIGRQLGLVSTGSLYPEIPYNGGGALSVDWILVTEQAVVLVECKAARLTLGAQAGDASLAVMIERVLGKARSQIDTTATLIRNRHPNFAHIPEDRPIIGLVVTAEPFYLANSTLGEYGSTAVTPSLVGSLRDLEHLVSIPADEVVPFLLEALADEERRTWSISIALGEQKSPVPKNPILVKAWREFDFRERDGGDG